MRLVLAKFASPNEHTSRDRLDRRAVLYLPPFDERAVAEATVPLPPTFAI